MTESESLLIGRDFGVVTDIKTSPAGTLYSWRSTVARSMRFIAGSSA